MVREDLANGEGDLSHVLPRDSRAGIKVHAQLVGMVDVVIADRMRVEVDAAEVHDPGERGAVRHDHLVGGAAGGERELDCPDELGNRGRRALLEERLPGRAVHEALERHGAVHHTAQGAIGDGEVILDKVSFRRADLTEEDFVRIRDGNREPIELHGLRLASRHGDRLADLSSLGEMVNRMRRILTRLDAWIARWRITRTARATVMGFFAHEALQYAGAMAYFIVLSLVNVFTLGVVAASFVVGEGAARSFVIDRVSHALPVDASQIGLLIDRAVQARGSVGLIGLVLLLWSALGAFGALSSGISRVFVLAPKRAFWKDRLIGLALLGAIGILAAASVTLGL